MNQRGLRAYSPTRVLDCTGKSSSMAFAAAFARVWLELLRLHCHSNQLSVAHSQPLSVHPYGVRCLDHASAPKTNEYPTPCMLSTGTWSAGTMPPKRCTYQRCDCAHGDDDGCVGWPWRTKLFNDAVAASPAHQQQQSDGQWGQQVCMRDVHGMRHWGVAPSSMQSMSSRGLGQVRGAKEDLP